MILLSFLAVSAQAAVGPQQRVKQAALEVGKHGLENDLPARAPAGFARTDTLDWGGCELIAGESYAVLGGVWDWDPPFGDCGALEGWYAIDQTANVGDYFQQITTTSWNGHGNEVSAPIINGTGSIWCGLFEDQADALCWDAGLGYGNDWCQRMTSPAYTWGGNGDVNLSFSYFNDSEADYDYSRLVLAVGGMTHNLNGAGFTDIIGTPPQGPWATYDRAISPAEFGVPGPAEFQVYFEFDSDGGWSDEDGDYTTSYGPFGYDDFSLSGDVDGGPYLYNYDSDAEGWTAGRCPGVGSYFSIQPVSNYIILSPCACDLVGNVAAFHNAQNEHPVGQTVSIWSPPADRTDYQPYNKIMCDWDQYGEMPQNNGVFYRPGWSYYPYLCPATGEYGWSGRKGQNVWRYSGDQPVCEALRNIGTDWGVPTDCQLVGFVYEVTSSCDAFGIPSTVCTGQTNFTPIIDNVKIRMTGVVNAPVVQFDVGDQFQDGFNQGDVLSVFGTGNADVCRPITDWPNPDDDPWILGDSLVVIGPTVTPSTKWDAKLWFRVKREGPGQIHVPAYRAWKNKVADGRQIVGPQGAFTFGWMDSVEVGPVVYAYKFASYFRENDDDYSPGPPPKPEFYSENEIIKDGILAPGTKIEYFVTANYICLPTTYSYYPDTTGGTFWEFEILPSLRTDYQTGYYKFPCILYVDAYERGAQPWIEGAYNILLNGHAPEGAMSDIPDPTKWDRYDYLNVTSNFHAPMIRNIGGNNGATIPELLGYRFIMFNTGDLTSQGVSDYRDWQGFENWLTTSVCSANLNLQAFWASGDGIAGIINETWPSFLNDRLGAVFVCDQYATPDCPPNDPDNDQNYCTRLETVGAAWTPAIPLDVWGNWCPQQRKYDVLDLTGSGAGQKGYRKLSPNSGLTDFAQVINDLAGDANKYRSIIDGYSIEHVIDPVSDDPLTGCDFDTLRILSGMTSEMAPLIRWALNLGSGYDLTTYGLCVDPCLDPLSVPQPVVGEGAPVTRLYQNSPNPFSPSTAIRFSLARTGRAKITICDVGGRVVRTLADGPYSAGSHVLVWDGLDDAGRRVAAGIYWSQLTAGEYSSNRKMVVIH